MCFTSYGTLSGQHEEKQTQANSIACTDLAIDDIFMLNVICCIFSQTVTCLLLRDGYYAAKLRKIMIIRA